VGTFPASVHNCGWHGPEPSQNSSYEAEQLITLYIVNIANLEKKYYIEHWIDKNVVSFGN
jgi:hypothetical protein